MKYHKNSVQKVLQKIKEQPLIFILSLCFIVRIFYISLDHPLWWDSHVYIGMGKYLFSGGEKGVWESFRPLIHPLILGSIWKLKLNVVLIGKILDVLFSLLSVYVTYKIGEKVFNRNVASIAALVFGLSAIFLTFTGLILTEPLAILLGLLGVYFFIIFVKGRELIKLFLAGIFCGLSFLTKFPQGIYFGALFLVMFFVIVVVLFKKKSIFKRIRELFIISLGFSIPVIPYFVFNYFRYPHILKPFTSASWIVTTSTWLYGSGLHYYFVEFFLRYPINLFFVGYIYYFFKEEHWKKVERIVLFLIPVLIFLYFLYVPRKEIRYMVTALPFFSLLISYTIVKIYNKLKKSPKPRLKPFAFVIICTILVIINIPTTLHFESPPSFEEEIIEIIKEHNINGIIMSSDPSFISFTDNRKVLLNGMEFAPRIYAKQDDYELLFINDCDLICAPTDIECQQERGELLSKISRENEEVFKEEFFFKSKKITCTYTIHLPNGAKN